MWSAAERRLLEDLLSAERSHDVLKCAECRANLGHLAEIDDRIGDAVRHWSIAVALLDDAHFGNTAEVERLVRLIRRWHELPRVWISYAHSDMPAKIRITRSLRRRGVEVRSDANFVAGHQIEYQVKAAIQHCPKYIVLWSRHAQNRPWVEFELVELRKRRYEDIENRALDNCVIFYCLDHTPVPEVHSDDLVIQEAVIGSRLAARLLAEGLRTSVLAG